MKGNNVQQEEDNLNNEESSDKGSENSDFLEKMDEFLDETEKEISNKTDEEGDMTGKEIVDSIRLERRGSKAKKGNTQDNAIDVDAKTKDEMYSGEKQDTIVSDYIWKSVHAITSYVYEPQVLARVHRVEEKVNVRDLKKKFVMKCVFEKKSIPLFDCFVALFSEQEETTTSAEGKVEVKFKMDVPKNRGIPQKCSVLSSNPPQKCKPFEDSIKEISETIECLYRHFKEREGPKSRPLLALDLYFTAPCKMDNENGFTKTSYYDYHRMGAIRFPNGRLLFFNSETGPSQFENAQDFVDAHCVNDNDTEDIKVYKKLFAVLPDSVFRAVFHQKQFSFVGSSSFDQVKDLIPMGKGNYLDQLQKKLNQEGVVYGHEGEGGLVLDATVYETNPQLMSQKEFKWKGPPPEKGNPSSPGTVTDLKGVSVGFNSGECFFPKHQSYIANEELFRRYQHSPLAVTYFYYVISPAAFIEVEIRGLGNYGKDYILYVKEFVYAHNANAKEDEDDQPMSRDKTKESTLEGLYNDAKEKLLEHNPRVFTSNVGDLAESFNCRIIETKNKVKGESLKLDRRCEVELKIKYYDGLNVATGDTLLAVDEFRVRVPESAKHRETNLDQNEYYLHKAPFTYSPFHNAHILKKNFEMKEDHAKLSKGRYPVLVKGSKIDYLCFDYRR
eukprot:Nk52_evm4s321 gene=Nk52_evmTU4s321